MAKTVLPRSVRHVAIVAFPNVQSLDITGPLEVFAGAHLLLSQTRRHDRGYRVTIAGLDRKPLTTSSGLKIVPDVAIDELPAKVDTLIVAGGPGALEVAADPHVTEWVAKAATNARRTASVCTGAFVLAAAGLLDGRRVATHWAAAPELARLYPAVDVDPVPIFVREDPIWTSAGVTAGMDLALAMVEDDIDRELALTIARHLVLFLRRPANQAQFSATLALASPQREPLREAQRHALENPAADLSVEALAARAHMSPRHFARSFRAEVGITPGRYVERVRVEAARRMLEDSSAPIAAVATSCGFGAPETLRRTFLRALDVGPTEYRRRFQAHSCEAVAA